MLQESGKRLKAFQEDPSPQEDVEKIPMLSLSDISKEIRPFRNEETEIGGVATVLHDYHTNDIAYFDFCFDASELPKELIPYSTLLVEFYRYVDTEHFSYNELASEIGLKIGSLTCLTGINTLVWKKDGYRPYFSVMMKCLTGQIPDGMKLLEEVLFTSRMDDTARLKEIISEIRTKMDVQIPASGHTFASTRALSYIDPAMKYKDVAEGIGYYNFIKDLDRHFEERKDELVKKLRLAQSCIFRRENLTVSITGDKDYREVLDAPLGRFAGLLWDGPCVKSVPAFEMVKKNEGFKTSGKVQYVAAAGRFETEEYPYTGALRVLRTIFAYDYLWVNVRVTGGAYGAMCGFRNDGYGSFASYRDPKLVETLDTYFKAADYVAGFDVSDRDMTKYIIGTISGLDHPLEPAALGERSFSAYKSGITEDMLKKEREQVLTCTQETIRGLAPYVARMMDEPAVCAIGSDKMIEDQKKLFGKVSNLTQDEEA